MKRRECKPESILRTYTAAFPNWLTFAAARRDAARAYGENAELWRAVYCPRDSASVFFWERAGGRPRNQNDEVAMVVGQALAAWRMGMSVYRFDHDFARALVDTPLTAGLPAGLLARLPEWGIWVESAGIIPGASGFFAALDGTEETGLDRTQITLWLDDDSTLSVPITLEHEGMSLCDSLSAIGVDVDRDEGLRQNGALFAAAINLTLYLCSAEPDYRGSERPKNPEPVKTKRGMRLFPASAPRYWDIGKTVGERLRRAAPRQTTDERNAPRPHLRRAHWHTFRIGEKRAGHRVRWLHPILVGYNNDGGNDE